MPPSPTSGRPAVCPPRDELAAFSRGELPDAALERLAQHLSGCGPCAATLEALRASDTVVARLREALQGPPVEESGLDELEARARALIPDLAPTAEGPSAVTEAQRPAEAWPLSRPFGPYELLEKLGQGGMGVVYKARQTALNRLVALKHLHAGSHAGPEERARFRTEGEALARVRHANVVQVYEVGEHDGQPYLAMELVEGGSLARRLAEGPLPQRRAAELVRALARAVHAIHRRGVVHRDLKPGNVLLEADGTPKVSDFGLAKLLDTEAEHTHTGTVLGTPAYMAPEQAEGRSRHVGPATDVWALGATLYECLTGRRAFEGRSRAATLELVRRQGPAPPLRWPRGLSRDLEAVCLKCLQKEPAKRYPSAEALAEDLGRWLENKPTQARPLGRAGRALRALARHPRWVTAAALGLLTALGAGAAWALRDPDGPVQRIEAGLARGEAVTLIGEKGGPKWHRWVEGDQEGRVATEPDGTFTVHCSASVALVELVRDPRQARFRLRAEVRHDVSGDGGKVGVYFGRHPCPTAGGPVHHFGALTYNDIRDEVERFHLHFAPNLEPGTPAPPGNKIDLGPHLYARGGGAPWEQTFVGSRGYLTRGGAVKGRWRPLAVVVTPDGVEAVLDGWPVAALAAARWDKLVRGSVASLRDSFPDQPYAQGLDPAYSPGGGLGLYVERSSASFRRVVVEPLDKPN